MSRINHVKLKRLRESMYLDQSYLVDLLHCSLERYNQIENGETSVNEHELKTLCIVFNISEQHLLSEDIISTKVFARAHDQLTENDGRQINEFLTFQKMLKKKKKTKELVIS